MIAQIKPMMGGGWMSFWKPEDMEPQRLFVATRERVVEFLVEFLEMGYAVELCN